MLRSRTTIGFLAASGALAGALVAAALGGSPAGSDPAVGDLLLPDHEARAVVADLRAAADGAQATALADGQVTMAEYRAAAVAATGCLQGRLEDAAADLLGPGAVAVEVSAPDVSDDGYRLDYGYAFDFGDGVDLSRLPSDVMARVQAVDDGCRQEHLAAVEQARHVTLLADEAFVQEVDAGFRACLGAPDRARDESARDELARLLARRADDPTVLRCAERYPSLLDDPTS